MPQNLVDLSNHLKLKDYLLVRSAPPCVVRKLVYGSGIDRTREVVMTALVTLTATTVLLSSLLLLRRIW